MAPRSTPEDPDLDVDDVVDEPTNTRGLEPQAVLLDGRYRVKRLIARGGMSVVHLAEQVDLQRDVALKVLRPPPSVQERFDFAEAFKQEARTLASLRHPNVVTLHDFGRVGKEEVFLAMEFVDGRPLSEVLEDGPLRPEHAVRLLLQVCLALRYTHARGVVHRDMKPSNLLVTLDDEGEELVKVIDFGIAGGDLDADKDLVIGSPDCMAPEQITGDPVGPPTDVYGVGCVLFRTLTGRYPFKGGTAEDKLVAHVTADAPSLRETAPELDLPPALDAVLRRCLQKAPADRYPDMDGLIDDLAAYLGLPDASWRTGSFISPRVLRQAAEGTLPRSTSDGLTGPVRAPRATVRPAEPRGPDDEAPPDAARVPDASPLLVYGGAAAVAVVLILLAALLWRPDAPGSAASPEEVPARAEPPPAEVPAAKAPPPAQPEASPARPAGPAPRATAPAPRATAPGERTSVAPRPRPAPRPSGAAAPAPSSPPAPSPADDEEVDAPKGYKAMPEF